MQTIEESTEKADWQESAGSFTEQLKTATSEYLDACEIEKEAKKEKAKLKQQLESLIDPTGDIGCGIGQPFKGNVEGLATIEYASMNGRRSLDKDAFWEEAEQVVGGDVALMDQLKGAFDRAHKIGAGSTRLTVKRVKQ